MSLLNVNMVVCAENISSRLTSCRPLEWREQLIICHWGQQAVLCFIFRTHTHKTLHKLHIDWTVDYCLAVNVWVCVCTACLQSRRNQKTWNSLLTNFGCCDKTRKGEKKSAWCLLKIEYEALHMKVSFLSPVLGKSTSVSLLICRLSCLVMLTSTHTDIFCYII